ncbi:unnamed protein product [Cladocopium goreaui]|uniref:PNPLA domain-containing protein n=1 Tax=Cladocopium goreaui TaxID=2562237 RepID=A0A9P1CDA3_9DINO|nr:unnamed protein product [Cladocopium goreaui]
MNNIAFGATRKLLEPQFSPQENGSDSDSESGSSESSSEKKKKKKAKKEKKKKKKDKKDKKSKKNKKAEKKGKKKKEKKKKKKKGDDLTEAMRGSVSNQFGKYGIIKAEDFFSKKPEFMLWAQEVRKVNTDILGQMQLKDLFKEYVEDYNTATMPSKKYYNIQVFEQQMSNKRRKKKAETVIDTALQSSLASFDDEKARRDEVLALRAKKQENQISSEAAVQRLRMNKEKAEDMKHQAMLKTQQSMLSKAGQVEAAGKISERLNPNKVDYAERRAKKLDGPVGFQPEG